MAEGEAPGDDLAPITREDRLRRRAERSGPLPELEQLAAFAEIVRAGGFHAAARRLGVAQPSLSARIKELEGLLGVALLERGGRRLKLTPEGRELLDYAQRILALGREAVERVGARDRPAGRVRLGTTAIPAVTWLPHLMARLARLHPAIRLEFVVESSETLAGLLRAGALDLACLAGPLEMPGVAVEPLGEVAMAWLAGPGIELPAGPLGPAELARVPIITDTPGSHLHGLALVWFATAGVEPECHHACPSLPTRIRLAALGLGVAMAPVVVARRELAEGSLRILDTRPPLPGLPYLLAVAGAPPSPAVAAVAELARRAMAEEPAWPMPVVSAAVDRR